MVLLCKKIMEHIGLNPGRLRLETMSAGDGILFTELMNDFGKQVRGFGPLGKGEGIDENVLKSRIQAAYDIVPFIRLVERERMRLPVQSAEVYYNFFNSDEFSKLFKETVLEKLVDSQIISLLRERPRTSGEIVKVLELTPSEVSRHLNITLRQGLVRYEESEKRFAIA
jgi:DNA-binding transcriptional ArsR family regulator